MSTRRFMEDKIRKIIENVYKIEAIGNHHLKRHHVYKVSTDSQDFIVKFYGVSNRYQNELYALRLLENSQLPTPTVIDHGILDGHEYTVMSYLEGEPMDRLDLRESEKHHIYIQAGMYLKEIHNTSHQLDYGRVSSDKFDTFDAYFKYEVSRIVSNLRKFDHPNPEVIKRGVEAIENVKVTSTKRTLCHMDFSERNILIHEGKISGIIDFEHAIIADVLWDMAYVTSKIQGEDLEHLYEGYGRSFDGMEVYKLLYGLGICSWSLPVDREYYEEGIKLIKENL